MVGPQTKSWGENSHTFEKITNKEDIDLELGLE